MTRAGCEAAAPAVPRLSPRELRAAPGQVIGHRIACFDALPSTQDAIRELGCLGAPEGVAVFAETQTAGRGRRGRAWVSPPGRGLWFSVLLRPALPPERLPQIPLAAAVALARACREAAGVTPGIKWPNDLLWEGRKLGGILAERVARPESPPFVVLGVGINVDLPEGELPPDLRGLATSLRAAAGGAPVDRAALARRALSELDDGYRRLTAEGFAGIRAEWRSLAAWLGRPVEVRGPDGAWAGTAVDLDEDGALLVDTPDGRRRFLAGEVSLRRLGGAGGEDRPSAAGTPARSSRLPDRL